MPEEGSGKSNGRINGLLARMPNLGIVLGALVCDQGGFHHRDTEGTKSGGKWPAAHLEILPSIAAVALVLLRSLPAFPFVSYVPLWLFR
jgi:hypothetical protein